MLLATASWPAEEGDTAEVSDSTVQLRRLKGREFRQTSMASRQLVGKQGPEGRRATCAGPKFDMLAMKQFQEQTVYGR